MNLGYIKKIKDSDLQKLSVGKFPNLTNNHHHCGILDKISNFNASFCTAKAITLCQFRYLLLKLPILLYVIKLFFFCSSEVQFQLRGSCIDDFDTQFTLINRTHLIGNMNSLMIYDNVSQWDIVDKSDLRGVIL